MVCGWVVLSMHHADFTYLLTEKILLTRRGREREREMWKSRLFMGGLANEEFEDNAICISFIW